MMMMLRGVGCLWVVGFGGGKGGGGRRKKGSVYTNAGCFLCVGGLRCLIALLLLVGLACIEEKTPAILRARR